MLELDNQLTVESEPGSKEELLNAWEDTEWVDLAADKDHNAKPNNYEESKKARKMSLWLAIT